MNEVFCIVSLPLPLPIDSFELSQFLEATIEVQCNTIDALLCSLKCFLNASSDLSLKRIEVVSCQFIAHFLI